MIESPVVIRFDY